MSVVFIHDGGGGGGVGSVSGLVGVSMGLRALGWLVVWAGPCIWELGL